MKHVTAFNAAEYCWTPDDAYGCYQDYQTGGYGVYDTSEYDSCATDTQPVRPVRQDSLICFSMNFHANSIQVMTAPQPPITSTTGTTNSVNQTDFAGNGCTTYNNEHYRHYANGQSTTTCGTSTSNNGNKSICCYLADTCQNSCY